MIGISGRRFDVAISESDIEDIRSATDREEIGGAASRAWDKIVDWFCGTKREEAKKCLFDLYSKATPKSDKLSAFRRLKELSGNRFKDNFVEENNHQDQSVILKLNIDGLRFPPITINANELIVYSLKLKMKGGNLSLNDKYSHKKLEDSLNEYVADKGEDSQNRNEDYLARDLNRAKYLINGKAMDKLEGQPTKNESINKFRENINRELKPTEYQKFVIESLARQKILNEIVSKDNTNPDDRELLDAINFSLKGNGDPSYDLIKEGNNIRIKAQFQGPWNEDYGNNPDNRELFDFCKKNLSPTKEIEVIINPMGRVTVDRVNFMSKE